MYERFLFSLFPRNRGILQRVIGCGSKCKKGEWSVDNFAFFILKTKVLLNHF